MYDGEHAIFEVHCVDDIADADINASLRCLLCMIETIGDEVLVSQFFVIVAE